MSWKELTNAGDVLGEDADAVRTVPAAAAAPSLLMGRTPQEWLQVGDVMETEVEGIGILRNRVVAA